MLRSLLCALVLTTTAAAQTVPSHPAISPTPLPHEWARGAVFYEIAVRNFADSNGDGIGDLKGLTSKLDYLNDANPKTTTDLGIDAISLVSLVSPLDFEKLDKDLGTAADFKRFLDEAHKRRLRVLIELPLNHTSVEHPWFVDSATSAKSKKRDWYVWRAENPAWKQVADAESPAWHARGGAFYYGAFGSATPDLNYDNPAVKAEMVRIARHWLAQGVDGLRLGATRYLVETGGEGQADMDETQALLKEFVTEAQRVRAEAIVVGDGAADAERQAPYFGALSTTLNDALGDAIVGAMAKGSSTAVPKVLQAMFDSYPKGVIDAPFLTRHGEPRVATTVTNPARVRKAAALLLTMTGAPFIRAGDEIGLQDGATLMPWKETVDAQSKDPESLLSYYRNLIAARKRTPTLAKGWVLPQEVSIRVILYQRYLPGEAVVVVHNIADVAWNVPLPVAAEKLTPVLVDKGVAVPNTDLGTWTVRMQPHTTAVWKIE